MQTQRNDPDSFTQGIEITIDPTTLTIRFHDAGNLVGAQAVGQAAYSFLKEEWIADADLPFYAFPMDAITNEQFVFLAGWHPYDDASAKKISSCGWTQKSAAGATTRVYCGIISTPPTGLPGTDRAYYQHVVGTPTNFTYLGTVNEPVQIYGDSSNGNFDRRALDITVFDREAQRTFAIGTVFTNYSVSTLSPIAYRIGLNTTGDTKASVADTGIDANGDGTADVAPYSGMVFTSNTASVAIAMAGGTYNFKYTLDCNGGTIQQAYEYIAWLLRKNSDIDAHGTGTLNGKTAAAFANYVGDTLYTSQVATNLGVALTNFNAAGINSVVFTDNTGAQRTFPYTAAIAFKFSAAAVADLTAVWWAFPTADFGAPGCAVLLDASGNPMSGDVGGNAIVSKTWDWTTNGDEDVTAVVIGTSGCKYYRGTGQILQSTANVLELAAGEELNYLNPA
jgi:hypothetical protein